MSAFDLEPTLTSTIAGVLLGALVTALAFVLRERADRRVRLNRALFSLLEIHRSLRMTPFARSAPFAEIVARAFQERIPGLEVDALMPELGDVIAEAVFNATPNEDATAKVRLDAAVSDLSSYAPVLAIRVSSNHNLQKAVGHLDKQMNDLIPADIPAEQRAQLEVFVRGMSLQLYEDAAKEVGNDILLLAWKISPLTCFTVWRRVRKSTADLCCEVEQDVRADAERIVGRVLELLTKAQSA
jgi:hypothetical protein